MSDLQIKLGRVRNLRFTVLVLQRAVYALPDSPERKKLIAIIDEWRRLNSVAAPKGEPYELSELSEAEVNILMLLALLHCAQSLLKTAAKNSPVHALVKPVVQMLRV